MNNKEIPAEELNRIHDEAEKNYPNHLSDIEPDQDKFNAYIRGAKAEFLRHLNSKPSGLRWLRLKDWPEHKRGDVVAKTNYGRNITAYVKDDGIVDWINRKYDDEKIILLLDESPYDAPTLLEEKTEDEQSQDELWKELHVQLQDSNLEGRGQAVIDWLKGKYSIIRKGKASTPTVEPGTMEYYCGRCGKPAPEGKTEGDYCHQFHDPVKKGSFCCGKITSGKASTVEPAAETEYDHTKFGPWEAVPSGKDGESTFIKHPLESPPSIQQEADKNNSNPSKNA